jgi:hypothetical protein
MESLPTPRGAEPIQPTEKLVLLALADWANDEGGSLHPSMAAIARKACVSQCQARRIVRRFMRDGLLVVEANAAGGKPGTTPHYRLVVDRLTASTDATPRVDATPITHATPSTDARGSVDARARMDDREGSHGCEGRASTHASRTISYPSENHQEKPVASRPPSSPTRSKPGITFPAFIAQCEQEDRLAIDEADPVHDYAEKVGIPVDLLELAWWEFRDRHRESAKRYRDWRQAFRNCVRDNWYRLWTFDAGGACVITGQGRQAQAAHRAEAVTV